MKRSTPVTLSRRQLMAGLAVLSSGGAATLKPVAALAAPSLPVKVESALLEPIALSLQNIITEGITDVFRQPAEVDLLAKDVRFRNIVARRTLEVISRGAHPSECFSPLEFVDVPKRTYGRTALAR